MRVVCYVLGVFGVSEVGMCHEVCVGCACESFVCGMPLVWVVLLCMWCGCLCGVLCVGYCVLV